MPQHQEQLQLPVLRNGQRTDGALRKSYGNAIAQIAVVLGDAGVVRSLQMRQQFVCAAEAAARAARRVRTVQRQPVGDSDLGAAGLGAMDVDGGRRGNR